MAPKRNAFYYFMLEFKQGGKFSSMKEIAIAASPQWRNLSKEQKQPYEERARLERSAVAKLNSDGISVEEIEREERLKLEREANMKMDIQDTLKICSDQDRIQDELFFIIHMNIFCYNAAQNRYYPAEIAVTCFSLENGVLPQCVFHKVIKPGSLPLGFSSEAKLISEKTHKLPIPCPGDDNSNIEEVYDELKYFLSTKLLGSKRFPPLYTDVKMSNMVQQILDSWCHDFGESKPLFKVYNLQYMFMVLRNMVAKNTVWPTETYSSREIEKDAYMYATGLCCSIHEKCEMYQHCSRSVVIRYAYIICDNCCEDLNIVLVPGTHLPDSAMVNLNRTSSYSSLLSDSSVSTSNPSETSSWKSVRDDDSYTVTSFSIKSESDEISQISEAPSDLFVKNADVPNSEPWLFSDASNPICQSGATEYSNELIYRAVSTNVSGLSCNMEEFSAPVGRGRKTVTRGFQRKY